MRAKSLAHANEIVQEAASHRNISKFAFALEWPGMKFTATFYDYEPISMS